MMNDNEPLWITIEMAFRDVEPKVIESMRDDIKDYIKKYKFADKMTTIDVW